MKNIMEKIKKDKRILVRAGAVIAAIAIILLIIVGCINLRKSQNRMSISTPELARALEYDRFIKGVDAEDGVGDDAVDGTDNVKFSAFFLRDLDGDGYAESIKGTCKPIGEEDTLYMELIVQTEGYLKDAKVEIQGQNFYLQTAIPKDDQLKDNYIGNNIKVIEFNQAHNGFQKLLTGIVKTGAIGNNINNYSRDDNKIVLTGTYVNGEGEEIAITKEILLTVDWYGTTKAGINAGNTYYDLPDRIDEENGTIKLDFVVSPSENDGKLILSKNHVEGTIPELNGYAPIEVKMTNTTSANLTFSYDETNKTFSIDRTATVGEDGAVTTTVARQNNYNLQVTYPIEAYQAGGEESVTIKVPVQTYYEGYNNPNSQFENPYKSNIAKSTIVATYSNPRGTVANIDVTVGKVLYNPNSRYVVSKQKPLRIYNELSEEEKDDTYLVRWYAYTGTDGETTGLVLKETRDGQTQVTDEFIKADSSSSSMENVTSNIGIYFSGADNFLKEDGWIKVYDEETDNLLATFTKENWGKYTASNPYKYELPVKHIRVETSATNKESSLSIYNVKELDDEYITENFTKEEFDNLKYIKSTLSGYLGGNYLATDTHQANYEAPFSIATIKISNNNISTQATEEHEKITITASNDSSSNQVGWVDGSFLVKFPEEILNVKINSVEINNSSVDIATYELIEEDVGKFIKINTKNNNDTAQSYTITIDADITPDPRLASSTRTIELYASNKEAVEYYYKGQDIYDVNDNLNTDETINKTTTSISLVAPGSLLTNQTASEYDSKNSMIVSPEIADVIPIYAKVDNEKQTAKIGVQLKNNYSSTISEVMLLGKIPFEGNTTVVSGVNLKSEYTTKMLDTGISIPEALQGKVTIYYSENETPNRDLSDTENRWTLAENVTNWDNIKTFLIDFGDVVLERGSEYVFYYTIEIPDGIEFNKISYSHHGVWFSLDTEQGKYRTQTEPNKIGFRIAEKFNLELTKTQTGKDKLVPGATYSVTEIGVDETTGEEVPGDAKTAVTNAQGTLTITNLYAERVYEIREIKTPDDYELNEDVIRIIGHVDEKGTLTIDKTQGTTKEEIGVIKEEGEKHKATAKVEDEAKAKLKITKKEQGTEIVIRNVKYRLTGAGLPTNGKVLTTNVNGEATVNGLKINEEYTLEETKATGYYLASPIKFRIVNNDGTYGIEITEGTVPSYEVTEEDSLPILNLTLEDEKIPTYNLEIFKIKKTVETTLSTDELIAKAEGNLAGESTDVLEGAKFKLYKDDKQIGEYITGADGKITIENLYQYVDGKDENATYTLKEVIAPDGYAKVKDLSFKAQVIDGTLKLINIDGKEEKFSVEGSTIKLVIEDSPSFKLIKKDAETGEVLANVKFAIYNVDEGVTPAKNSKGEILGTKEIINGREYYTVTTDSNGIITADLTEGLYKAVEVQAPDKYDIKNKEYYFGIGSSREEKTGYRAEWGVAIGGNNSENINSVAETSDGGYIVGGYFYSSSIDLGNGVTLTNNSSSTSYSDGMLIKYDAGGEVEWAKGIGGSEYDRINSVAETSDGGYIVGGYFNSSSIDLGNGVTLTNHYSGTYDGMLIKYDAEGNAEWAKSIGGTYYDQIKSVAGTSDGGYIVGAYFQSSSINLGNGVILGSNGSFDGMIIKYDAKGNAEWAKGIGGSSDDHIGSVAETRDGGYIVGGYFKSSSIDLGNGVTLTNNSSSTSYSDGMVIKYDSEGSVEWGKAIGGSNSDEIASVTETRDGGYIVGGEFYGNIDLGNGVTLTNNSSYSSDGILIKYDAEGKAEWAKAIGGGSEDKITSVAGTSDGGYIVGGYFSDNIDLGNGVILGSNGSFDGMIIKYDANGNAEWAKGIGGSTPDYITSVAETRDGGYIVGGYFYSSSINLGNGVTLTNNSSNSSSTSYSDVMVIKYSIVEVPEVVIKQAKGIGGSGDDQINSVAKTSDGGYIVGGYFRDNIDLGNGVTLTNNSSETYYYDGMIIKYDAKGNVEWAKGIGGSHEDVINSVAETSDRGYIIGGYFESGSIDLGNGVTLSSKGNNDGMIIKYDAEGKVEWAKGIGGSNSDSINSVSETSDGGYIVGGYFGSSIDLENGVTLSSNGGADGIIIKYDAEGNAEWAKGIGGSSGDYINSVAATSDGGYIVGGYFNSSSIDLGNGVILTKSSYSHYYGDGVLIKYSKDGVAEWAKTIKGDEEEKINSVIETKDRGYIASGDFTSMNVDLGNGITLRRHGGGNTRYDDGMIIKYDVDGNAEWAKGIGGSSYDYINSVAPTSDGGYIVGGYFSSSSIDLGNGVSLSSKGSYDGMLIKYSRTGDAEWAKGIGGSSGDYINSVVELSDGNYIAGGYFKSSSIDLGNGNTLTNNGAQDGMIIKIAEEMGVPEVQEITVENERKEFKITTDVNEIDGIKGGSISGENQRAYETVKYGDNSTKEIIMTPDENYEIIGITVNGEEYPFTANEDGTYTMPLFTNVTEDIHVEVTYSLKDNKIIINKIDSETKESLPGATFKLDQLEEREEPKDVIGNLTDNGQGYDEVDTTKDITTEVLGEITDNGQDYPVADTTAEVTGVLGELTNNGTYYFVEQDGKYVPTNSKTYQVANGGTAGKGGTTANSYIEIDLSDREGEYAVVVNAKVSSENNYDFGYATITETTTVPSYSTSTGRFIYISGTVATKDYTSMVLQGGKIYYLHLGYRKDGSGDTSEDQIVFNSIKLYGATSTRYNFVENGEGGYESTNQGQASTVANSYIPIDLSSMTGKYKVVVNAKVSSQSSDYGYVTITENTDRPSYSASTGRFIYISGTSTSVTTPTDYTSMTLEGGKTYYLHLGYYKNASTDTGDDKFTVNSVKVYETKVVTYNFIENEEGGYESTIQGKDDRVANSYIPIDLSNTTGKYNLIVNANVSSQSGYDMGYATITENTNRPAYNTSTGRFIYISGTTEAVTTPTDYTTVLEGGKLYYLHLGYYKNASTSTGDDKFTVNSISITLNDSDLYHTEVTTNSEGQAITQIPFGKYSVTEIQAPEGYELNENSIVVEFRADENHEFTIENNKLAKVIVHHYLKGTTTPVAEDEILQDKVGYEYKTQPHLDLEKYELEKDEDGNYIIPENAVGQFVSGEQVVIYYYEEKEIPLIVNHYIEGTETPVPLLDGSNAETITSQGKEGESYTTTAIPNAELSNEYELVEIPSNSTGTYQGDKVEVTYYYKKVVRNLTINKYAEDGVTPLEGAKFTISNKDESKNNFIKAEKIQNNGTYYFTEEGNKYIPNNKGKHNTTANSYLKIDLTKSGNVDLTVNAEVSSESRYDFGYATVTESKTAPSYSTSTGRFISISGTVSAKDYTTQLQGGKVYYLHLGYRKDGSGDSGADTFTINSIKIDGKDYKEYLGYTTDSTGKIEQVLGPGEYVITEVQAPEGYQLPENATREITISRNTENIAINITNIRKQGKVTVHYYIEGTETQVPLTDETPAQDVIKTGPVGDMYVTTEASDISTKYELVAVPENSSGNITEEETVVIYYYRLKDTNVVVHHYVEGTTESLSEDVTIPGKVDDKYTTSVANDIPSKYELVATPENATGSMTEDQTVVTYYYRLKDTNVVVHHYKEGTTESLSADVNIPGKVDDEYTTSVADDIPSKYELVEIPVNANGVMTEDETVVIYYYRLKDTSVLVHHYIEGTTTQLSDDVTINGKVDDEYTTNVANDIPSKYELVATPANANGTMTEDQIVVTYYYRLKDTNVVVHYYKEGTTESLSADVNIPGKVEDEYTTNVADDIPSKYELVEMPANANGVMTEDETVVIYYYRLKDTSVLVHHYIEGTTTQLSDDVTIPGKVDDKYTTNVANDIPSKYELVATPENANGTMTEDQIVVTYYYRLKDTNVVVHHYKEGTTESLSADVNIPGKVDDPYTTSVADDIPSKYELVEMPANANGTMTEDQIVVTYYYRLKDTSVLVHHYIEGTTESLSDDVTIPGKVDDKYTTSVAKDIPSKYELVATPANANGTMTEDQIVVTYYYRLKDTNVVVHHYVEGTTTKLSEDVTISGKVDDEYTTSVADDIPSKYELVEMPANANGKMTEEEIVVIYYYRLKDTSVLVHHYLEGTTESLSPDVTIEGQVDDEYVTEVASDILDRYELVATPENAEGVMTEEQIVVTYYYSLRVANITHAKSQQIGTNKNFVKAGDKITYTVTVSNSGNLGKDVVVKDDIPTGTTLVEGSVKLDGIEQDTITAEDLANGITINVPMAENGVASVKTLSFEVTVNEGATGDIKNTAIVDGENTNETTVPVLTYEKEATVIRRTEESTLAENEVTAGDTINYVIKVHNTGTTKVEIVEVKDTVPTGTEVKTIENGGVQTDKEIIWTIPEIEKGKTAEVGFTVEVQYLRKETTIRNKAVVEGKDTNETENPYKKLPLIEESKVVKKATDKITSKDMKVYYELNFSTTINYFSGKAKITLVDTLPYPINEKESELDGGTYDAKTKTITWVEELNNLPVIIDEMLIERTKVLNLKFEYGDINNISEKLLNKVSSRIDLLEPTEENPDEYVGVKVDEREDTVETLVEIPAQVKVHHYIYDAEKNEYTTVKLAEDEIIDGIIGQEYHTTPSELVPKNYSCLDATPEKHEGKMTEETIEVTYYYQLATPTVENTMKKTATTGAKDKAGVAILTKEDGVVTYNIKYNVTVKDYIGKATIEIVDTLPEKIDVQKSELAGGNYNEETKTITWKEELEGIDTYANGTFTKEITKQIKLVYSNQNVLEDLVNTVTGEVKVYYPENHTTKPGEELETKTATDDETVKQEYKVTLEVNKKWEDNEDLKGKRPESVTIEIKALPDGEVLTEILNAENGWHCEITDLPKYDAQGNKIIYEVTEKETNAGDLEFYEEVQIKSTETQTEEVTNYKFTVINSYKLLDTDLITELTKQGTTEITSSKDVVEYDITLKVEVIDYIGGGKVKIVDILPYKIDEENSDLAEGIYDDDDQTITWEQELPHINTDVAGANYEDTITKHIKVVYKDMDLTQDKMTNKVDARIELYESEVKDEQETSHDTNINVDGKVIVRYVDKDTGRDIDVNYNYETTGKVGTDYTSEPKEIENYYYIESTNNETGKITEETQEVIYYYRRIESSVLVKYQDTEGNELLPDVFIDGQVGDEYTTEQKEIENYKFVSVTDNKEGTMTKEQIVVIYVYEKIPAKVIVKYIEKDPETGEERELLPEEIIDGFAGDDYITERKIIENYRQAEPEPDNKTGKMTEETTEVIYYYERIPSGIITVIYVDKDTGEEITYITDTEEEKTYRYEIKGFVGDEYETEEKEIPYYEFVEKTENSTGVLTEKEDVVIYYYRKQTFNLSVEKTIAGITLNGNPVKVRNDQLAKIEVRGKNIPNTELVVSYNIRVANNGEIKGKAKLLEIIPLGYEAMNLDECWKSANGVLETEVELEAGEQKDLIVNLRWVNRNDNIGTTSNIVRLDNIENPANYEELSIEDNTANAQVMIGIMTGPNFEAIFKIELAMSAIIMLLLLININDVSIIRRKK